MSSAIEGQLVFTIRLVQSKAPSAGPWGQSRLATREKVGRIGFGPLGNKYTVSGILQTRVYFKIYIGGWHDFLWQILNQYQYLSRAQYLNIWQVLCSSLCCSSGGDPPATPASSAIR
jgi:hypothetical protein